MEDPKEIILKTEYSNKFDEIRKDLVVQSYFNMEKLQEILYQGMWMQLDHLKSVFRNLKKQVT